MRTALGAQGELEFLQRESVRRGYKDPELIKMEELLDQTLEKSTENAASQSSLGKSPTRRKKGGKNTKYV